VPASLRQREIEFETVRVDQQGSVIERQTHGATVFDQDLGGGVVLELVAVPGGSFVMGSPRGQGYEDEWPQHRVTVASFLLGRYPITTEQWRALMGAHVCRFKGPRLPAEQVSWAMATAFCRRLALATGRAYGLPTEAQWEYACRAGSSTPFSFGETITTDLANYNGEWTYRSEPKGIYRHTTTDSGSFPPNDFGPYDMHGNLWEWCADAWHDSYEGAPVDGSAWGSAADAGQGVARGGSWHDTPDVCRSAVRLRAIAGEGDDFIGFRVALRAL